MAIFGGGVRPELGRTDYSAIARGGEVAAQMAGRGAEAMGKGLAGALEGAGKAIAGYQERKETNSMFNSVVDDAMKANTAMGGALARQLQIADPNDRGAWSAGLRTLGPDKRTSALMGRQLLQQAARQEQMAGAMGDETTGLSIGEISARLARAGVDPRNIPNYLQAHLAERQMGMPPPPPKLDQFGQIVQAEINAFMAENGREPTPQEVAGINRKVKEMARPLTTVNVGDQTEDRETSSARVTRNRDTFEKAEAGVGSMRQTIQLKELLESGDVNTGIFANIKQQIDRFVASLGGMEAAKKATATEKAKSFMASEVFQYIQQLGLGSRNFDTPAERAFIEIASTGDITMTRNALIDLAKKRYDEARRNVEKYNTRVKESEGFRDWVKGFNYDVPIYDIPEWRRSQPAGGQISPETEDALRALGL